METQTAKNFKNCTAKSASKEHVKADEYNVSETSILNNLHDDLDKKKAFVWGSQIT